jgi:hypothetical protein
LFGKAHYGYFRRGLPYLSVTLKINLKTPYFPL